MNNYKGIFIENLKFYRKQKGITQEKLSEKCECATPTIGNMECGRQLPSFDMIVKIAAALDISPADLFLRDASKSQSQLQSTLQEIFKDDIPAIIQKKLSVKI